MPIHSLHPDYEKSESRRKLVRDCLTEDAVEDAKETYLPKPAARDQADHDFYMLCAFFYGVCSWTLLGMVGSIFRKPGKVELPPSIDYLIDDIDGQGCGVMEQAKAVCNSVLPLGRHGLLLDHPEAPEGLTKAQEAELNLRWKVASYSPESIINWRDEEVNGITQLTMVVLKEAHFEKTDDHFERKQVIRYRLLLLTDEGYEIQVWTPKVDDPKSNDDYTVESHQPRAGRERILFIPFTFVGAEDNKLDVDAPPFFPLARANISHYKDSADWQNAVSMLGRPTLYMSGMTQEFIEILESKNMFPFKMGSEYLLPVPSGGQVGLVESESDKTLIERSMDRKERLMAMLGAKLVEDKKQTEATETHRIREGGKTSVLSSVTNNVEKAYQLIFGWAADFAGLDASQASFTLNHDFFEQPMTADQALKWVQVWQGRGMAKNDLHSIMQKGEVISVDRDREAIDGELAEETADIPRVADDSE